MSRGEAICGRVRDFPESEQGVLAAQDILSIAVVPVFVGREWWGFIGFDECRREREWGQAEMETLQMAASMLGPPFNALAERTLDEHARYLVGLNEIIRIAISTTNFQNMRRPWPTGWETLRGRIGCYITLWDEERGVISSRGLWTHAGGLSHSPTSTRRGDSDGIGSSPEAGPGD